MDGKNSGGLNDYTAARFAAEALRPPRLSDILLPPTSACQRSAVSFAVKLMALSCGFLWTPNCFALVAASCRLWLRTVRCVHHTPWLHGGLTGKVRMRWARQVVGCGERSEPHHQPLWTESP